MRTFEENRMSFTLFNRKTTLSVYMDEFSLLKRGGIVVQGERE